MIAVKTDGTLWTWGEDDAGILGHNDVDVNRGSPLQVGALTNWLHATMGFRHSAAVKTDGTLWAWGYNVVGQLGDGTTINKSSPIQVGALTTWDDVDTGRFHTLATTGDGQLWAFGDNRDGQLGDNTTTNRNSPIQVGALTGWNSVAAFGYSSVAAINA
jgi:alpha-tubulin suppressor-like RCC1 family protein